MYFATSIWSCRLVVKLGFEYDAAIRTTILDMYANCKMLNESPYMFRSPSKRCNKPLQAFERLCTCLKYYCMSMYAKCKMKTKRLNPSKYIYAKCKINVFCIYFKVAIRFVLILVNFCL